MTSDESRRSFTRSEVLEYIVTRYEISSDKVKEPITCALVTDLHNKVYGGDNRRLIDSIKSESPDLILCAGDLIVGSENNSYHTALSFVTGLAEIAPVYYSNGNHETEYRRYSKPMYAAYVRKLKQAGIHLLNNKSCDIVIRSTQIHVAGLEVSLAKYIKFRKPHCDITYIEEKIGKTPCDDSYVILLAHNPEFYEVYGEWGADLTVSGHYHGGLVRSPFSGRALLSPYGYPFPKFGVGIKELSPKHFIIASAGLGDHWIPLRIFDPRELVVIRISPDSANPSYK